MLVVFLIGQEFWLTCKSDKGDFKSFPSTLARLLALSSLSWVVTQFSRAIPRGPGAQEDQTNRWTEIPETRAVEEGHLFGKLHNPCGSLVPKQGGFRCFQVGGGHCTSLALCC